MSLEHIKNVQKEEDEFYLAQQREAARIRIDGKRQKPFDFIIFLSTSIEKRILITIDAITFDDLFKDIHQLDSNDLLMQMEQNLEPFFKFFLSEIQNTSILSDQLSHTEDIDSEQVYWAIIKQILTELITEKRPADYNGSISKSVKNELTEMFQSKSLHELNALESNVVRKLTIGGENLDFDYWENVLDNLRIWRAKLQLRVFISSISFEREPLNVESNENGTELIATNKAENLSIREPFQNYMIPLITPSIAQEDAHLLVLDVEEDRARLVRLLQHEVHLLILLLCR